MRETRLEILDVKQQMRQGQKYMMLTNKTRLEIQDVKQQMRQGQKYMMLNNK